MRCQQFNQVGVVCEDIHRPSLDRGKNLGMEVLDLVRHAAMLAEALTSCKGICVKPNVRVKPAPTAWCAGQQAQNGPRAQRLMTGVPRCWGSA